LYAPEAPIDFRCGAGFRFRDPPGAVGDCVAVGCRVFERAGFLVVRCLARHRIAAAGRGRISWAIFRSVYFLASDWIYIWLMVEAQKSKERVAMTWPNMRIGCNLKPLAET